MLENGYEKINIQWYPGHMTKAKRMIEDCISSVDAVCEIRDARIPLASGNPDIDSLCKDKPKLIVINRCDLADNEATLNWKKYFESQNSEVIITDARTGKGVNRFVPAVRELLAEKIKKNEEKGLIGKPIRIMILGIPNVGKSTFINKIAGKKAAEAGDRPGVTRGKQWIAIDNGIDLLDTPGILWPKFDSQEVGELLAITNAIRTEVFDIETLAANFMVRLLRYYPESIAERYKFTPDENMNGFELLEEAAKRRGFLISKGEYDISRMAVTLLKEYHEGKLGRLTLEFPG